MGSEDMICGLANALWLAGCLPERARFWRATTRIGDEQKAVLRRLLETNAGTEFGRCHGFGEIRYVEEYQTRVPISSFEAYEPWIDRVRSGSSNVLTREPVRLFEPTSGSSGATKLIPYTKSLQREFQRGIRAWIADLFLAHPELMTGQAYWSVSPPVGSRRCTSGGIPIGFDDDSAYVGGWQRRLVQAVMAAPSAIPHDGDIDAFRYQTLMALVRSSNLRLISVWNPSFLSLLVDRLPAWGDRLARDLASDPRAADRLRAALGARTAGERHAILWPKLRLISCWTDANAAAASAHLAALFPDTRMQGKGLIATEGFISFPLAGHDGAVLAVRSHFLEFAPLTARGEVAGDVPRLAGDLERGRRYEVIVSTGGGLYRYRLGDIVEVVGHVGQCPLIRFVGRHAYVSDWFGEKLNEAHVARALRAGFDRLGMTPSFAMLACDTARPSPGYVLYIDTVEPDDVLDRLAGMIDAELSASFHYNYARLLGQLAPVRIFRADLAAETYLAAEMRRGRRAGDVKPLALDRHDGWSQVFRQACAIGGAEAPPAPLRTVLGTLLRR